MFTKTPDYIISEYGYPKMENCKNINNKRNYYTNKQEVLLVANDKCQKKLLPLRQTLNEYYYKNLLIKDRAIANSTTNTYICSKNQQNSTKYNTIEGKIQKNLWNQNLKTKNFSLNNSTLNCKNLQKNQLTKPAYQRHLEFQTSSIAISSPKNNKLNSDFSRISKNNKWNDSELNSF